MSGPESTPTLVPSADWVAANTHAVRLRDGSRVLLRPIVPSDKARLEAGMRLLSPRSRYLRFLRFFERLSDSELRYLTEIDYHDHFAWVALAGEPDDQPGLGVARYIRDAASPDQAEAAVVVVDDWQGKGLGTSLLHRLAETARGNGITSFVAYLTPENPFLSQILGAIAATAIDEKGLVKVVVPIGEDDPGPANRALLAAAARGELTVVTEHS